MKKQGPAKGVRTPRIFGSHAQRSHNLKEKGRAPLQEAPSLGEGKHSSLLGVCRQLPAIWVPHLLEEIGPLVCRIPGFGSSSRFRNLGEKSAP